MKYILNITAIMVFGIVLSSCSEEFLEEKPLDFLSPEGALTNKAGFESAIAALHYAVRDECGSRTNATGIYGLQFGTDVATTGDEGLAPFKDYTTTLTPPSSTVSFFWNHEYTQMIQRANAIIDYAQKPAAQWDSEEEKNAIIAEARFLRAYTYNGLVNVFGGVPIADKAYTEPKLDFTRATKQETLEFIKDDLEFASQWLPETTTQDGRIVKAAADHLLAEVYMSLGDNDKAIASATAVINSGLYSLMTTRFGTSAGQPGDVYSDLFKEDNQNRSDGNMETIWALQYDYPTQGGSGGANDNIGNMDLRGWGIYYSGMRDPDNVVGFLVNDSLGGRGVGWVRGTNYLFYDIWATDWNDMRNSKYNIRRNWYYNNPASAYFGQLVTYFSGLDTMQRMGPSLIKVEGPSSIINGNSGRTDKEQYLMRLAETYLLRAEAYIRKGQPANALPDVNIVRARAQAIPATLGEMTLDYILDERARELTVEEQRKRTLTRFGNLVERVRLYNPRSGASIQDHHLYWPIPQSVIDQNIDGVIEQNPGYDE